jgi:hypothetical protein
MEKQVADLYEQIAGEESSTLGKLLSKIPGLSGYMERGRRREADQILRITLASRLAQTRLNLSNVHQALSRDIVLAMDYAESLGRADNLLMGLIGKINDAPQGYAGFFDAIKVKAEDLARIYSFDEQMLNHADQIEADVAALDKAVSQGANIDAALRELNATLQTANEVFGKRDEVIKGISF